MNTKLIFGGALTGLVLAGSIATYVSAQTELPENALSQEEAVVIALAEVPGEVLEVELESEDGTVLYEIEILSADGQEFEVEIAAETGNVLEVEAEDDDDGDDADDGENEKDS